LLHLALKFYLVLYFYYGTKRDDKNSMCFHLDNLTDKEMNLIESEIKKRKRQKNLYPDKKFVKSKSDTVEIPLFATNQINPRN
jgi:hypothetical protein